MARRGGPGSRAYRPNEKPPKKECCPTRAAMDATLHGRFRLARRYVAMTVRVLAARAAR